MKTSPLLVGFSIPLARKSSNLLTREDSPQAITPTADRDQPVSRRFEPSSRTALIGEQPNPWEMLHPQDATSRHRGAKPSRRYGLLGKMSLLSPGFLLSVERRRFHTQPPDHYALLSHLLDLYVSQSSSLVPLHSTADCQPA